MAASSSFRSLITAKPASNRNLHITNFYTLIKGLFCTKHWKRGVLLHDKLHLVWCTWCTVSHLRIRGSATTDGPYDTYTISVKILSNEVENKLYNKYTTNRSNDVRGLQLTATTHRFSYRHCQQNRPLRWLMLTMWSTWHGKSFQVQSFGQSPRGKYPNFWRYPNFLITLCGIGGEKPPYQKPARFIQSANETNLLHQSCRSGKQE